MHTQYPEENSLNPQKRDPELVRDCFKQGSLKKLVAKAHFLLKLDQELRKILPPDYQTQCQVMNIEGTTLTLGVNNAGLATRLRYQAREILNELKIKVAGLDGITAVSVKLKLG